MALTLDQFSPVFVNTSGLYRETAHWESKHLAGDLTTVYYKNGGVTTTIAANLTGDHINLEPHTAGYYLVKITHSGGAIEQMKNSGGLLVASGGQSNEAKPFTDNTMNLSHDVGTFTFDTAAGNFTAPTGDGAVAFCNTLTEATGLPVCYMNLAIGQTALVAADDQGPGTWETGGVCWTAAYAQMNQAGVTHYNYSVVDECQTDAACHLDVDTFSTAELGFFQGFHLISDDVFVNPISHTTSRLATRKMAKSAPLRPIGATLRWSRNRPLISTGARGKRQ